jgi:hypothetical protein
MPNAKISLLKQKLNQELNKPTFDYKTIEESLIIHLDDLDNIATRVENDPIKYPTGVAYVRDATNALPLTQRLPPDHPHLQSVNLLLRTLNIASSIEHVIKTKAAKDPQNILYDESIVKIHGLLTGLAEKLLKDPDQGKKFKDLEKDFFTELLPILNRVGLSNGLANPEDYTNLLDHYRSLASVMAPAKSQVTLLNHKVGDAIVQHIETAHPITKKTAIQKEQIARMALIGSTNEKNFHTENSLAFQEASAAFADKLAMDDRNLPAQARRYIAPTLKNGFVVHNEIIFPDNKKSEFWALRSGTLSYIGNGETDESCILYANENIQQLKTAAQEIAHKDDVHIATFVTDHFWNQQDQMVRITKAAAKLQNISASVLSTNWFGTFYPLDLHEKVVALAKATNQVLPDIRAEPRNRATRMGKVGDFINVIGANPAAPTSIVATSCASGQDRTSTGLEVAVTKWTEYEYLKRSINDANYRLGRGDVEKLRAVGCHNAMLATLTAPGSAGLKSDSIPDKYFSELTTKYFYRATSDTNKNPEIDYKKVITLLPPVTPKSGVSKTVLTQIQQYNSRIITQATSSPEIINAIAAWAEAAINYQTNKPTSTLASVGRWLSKGTREEEGTAIREMVTEAARALTRSAKNNTSLSKVLADINTCINEFKEEVPEEIKRGMVFEQLDLIATLARQQLSEIKSDDVQQLSPNDPKVC